MPELLKDRFLTKESLGKMIGTLSEHYPDLNKQKLKELIFDSAWDKRELKQKTRHVSQCLGRVLPESYEEAVKILMQAASEITEWESIVLPDFVEIYGRSHWELSMRALTEFTKYGTSEFGVRMFLIEEQEKTMAYLESLTGSDNENVRRYASEGCRPRQPWGISLPAFKKDPSPILPLLEKLKHDTSEYVRRSVANNLNDISKDHPDTVLEIAERWYGHNPDTDRLVKHACRTLLKAGNRRAMTLFGFGNSDNLEISDFRLDKAEINLGERITLSFSLDVTDKRERYVRLEYGVYYLKANGEHSRKVFQISENTYSPGSHRIAKRQMFADLTTRKHHGGVHFIVIIVNGDEKGRCEFLLRK